MVEGDPGWIASAWDGLQKTMDLINEKHIKVILNGGGRSPQGLAEKVQKLVKTKGYRLSVAFVDGDNLLPRIHDIMTKAKSSPLTHLDHQNTNVQLAKDSLSFLDDPENMPIVTANAYLGYRAIRKGLDEGADIIICGRVSDASPVIAAAAWWHGWHEDDYNPLAGALIAGHLIECSTYVTGANFAGGYKRPIQDLIAPGLPIAEIDSSGECIVTKHEHLGGFVTADTVRCQLLYELQGTIYLNSDVAADISAIRVADISPNRVHVSNVCGMPPPPTTKLAVFYRGGYRCEILLNVCGYATAHKWDTQEAQMRDTLRRWGALDRLDVLDFQRVGTPMENPDSQLASTTYMRIFAQARHAEVLKLVYGSFWNSFMAHFAGMHSSLDFRNALPRPFLGYFPAVIPQSILDEGVTMLEPGGHRRIAIGPPGKIQAVTARESYDTPNPVTLSSFGPTVTQPLGDLVLARSGDKGGNVNIGLFVQTSEQWEWLRSFLSQDRMRQLMGKDWKDWYFMERVEMPNIFAVHFVIYGPLGRGVSSSALLDSLGKGFAEYIRAVHVPIPVAFTRPESKL
jgi:hypothetical protein